MAFTKFNQPSFILRLLLGIWLAFISQSNVAYAQIKISGVVIAQRRPSIYQGVPPAPPNNELLSPVPTNPEGYTVPEVNSTSQRSIEFQSPQYRYNGDFAPYKVYINDSDYGLLQQARRISPRAFRRQFQGRSVIQLGAFRTENGARNFARQVDFNGTRTARVVYNDQVVYNERNGQEIPRRYADRGNYGTDRSNYYYVVIPGSYQELYRYRNEIRRYFGPAYVDVRSEPRGPHVAVGPFTERRQAEQWNSYLRQNLGYSNARVYYGK